MLHQEFHALAFCSEKIRQIDFGNCSRSLSSRLAQQNSQASTLQFLTPILSLLRSGITKCNRLIVSGNTLPQADVEDIGEHSHPPLALFERLQPPSLTTSHSRDDEMRIDPSLGRVILRS